VFEYFDITIPLNSNTLPYPGDLKFSTHSETTQPYDAAKITVTSMNSSLHNGTHIDAPAHFIPGAATIDQLPLNIFMGSAQVIVVDVTTHSDMAITLNDLPPLTQPRILFATNSFDYYAKVFNPDFAYLSMEVIDYLIAQNIVLVGIDTPSIDYYTKQTYSAHLQLLEHNVPILHGLNLHNIVPGDYYLTALPLNLTNLEASPVRAVLAKSI
jgi:arylformamidase